MLAWLTPDDIPELACFEVFLPDSDELRAAFRGALLLLADSDNWQEHGTATPTEIADLWYDAFNASFALEPCEVGSMTIPIGTVMPFAGATLPENCLWCDGSFYDPATYPDLYDEIGYAFGQSGTDFAVPDMRDSYAKGAGSESALGTQTGNNSLRSVPLLAHTHGIYQNAATGATVTSVVTGTKATASIQTQSAGDANPQIDIEPQRCVLNWYIVASV